MEGRPKQTRRSRSLRARLVRDPSASSGSERERSAGAVQPVRRRGKRAARNPPAPAPPPPPPPPPPTLHHYHHHPAPPHTRRKRQESSSHDEVEEEEDEEDIIDGFAIASFTSLDRLEQRNGLKQTGRRERWETAVVKRQKEEKEKEEEQEEEVTPDLDDSVFADLPSSMERTQERVKERLLKKTYSKKNKRFKSLLSQAGRTVPEPPVPELNTTANRSSSKDRLSESSTHSLSGRGYSCDSESDIDDKASDVGSEKLFSPTASKGVTSNESLESRTCSSTKVSGLQRSQEQSSNISFIPAVPSPTPGSAPTGSPAPAAPAAPPPTTTQHASTPALSITKGLTPPNPTPPLLRNQSHPPEHRVQPPSHHSRPIISHHHPLPYSLHDISSSPSSLPPKHHLPPSPHHLTLPSPAPPLPLSISSLSSPHYSLRSPSHLPRHPAMFATPATLPPPPTLPTNSLVVPGHPAATPYPEHDLLRQELNNRFLVQSSERGGRGPVAAPAPGAAAGSPLAPMSLLRAEYHQHQHMHQHQHTHQHTFTPFPASLPPATIIGPPTAPPMFDKYAPKLDNPFLRQSSFFSSYPPAMPGMPPLLPHPGPFSSLQGAFQPKASNPIDVAGRPGAVPHTLLQKDPRVTDPFRTSVRKPGKWCAVHVQIAWQIYHHQQKMKQMQLDPHKLDMNGKLDLFSRPPAPGVFPGFPYPHDLARPLFSSTAGHPAASPYGPAPHHSGFLPPSHLADAFSRSSSFGGLGNLSASAFGGLGNPSLGANSVFGPKEGPGLPGFSPHHDAWNRLHRTPPSFPTPPQWPKSTDGERSSSANSHEREREREREKEREREREKRDSSIGKDEKDKDRDSLDRNRHSNRSSPASAPVSYQISNLIRSSSHNSAARCETEKDLLERQREAAAALMADVKVKESRSPGKEINERSTSSADSCKPIRRSPSPYSKNILSDAGMKMGGLGLPLPIKDPDRDRKETSSVETIHKVKNDMKIKEERKEEQEVMVVGSEPGNQPHPPPPIHHHPHPAPPTSHQPAISISQQAPPPSPRSSDLPTPASLHGVPMPHSLPFPMSAMHQMGSLNVLDRARMAPFMGVNPLGAGRDRLPHPFSTWDPLREAYRNLDLQRRMDFQLRTEPGHRFPGIYDPDRVYREREPHDYSHQDHLLEVRREQERLRQQAEERERLHLREELDRARLHQLHQSPIEGHLPHMPPFMSHLGGMPYPRLSPSTAQSGLLNRTPPTAALSAPPPLVPAGPSIPRPASPRRTTPITTQDPREYSPSRNPKEVEAR